MLLKGIEEVGRAPSPLTAAEMVLIRIAHTADLPTPDELIKALGDGGSSSARSAGAAPANGGVASPQATAPANSAPQAVARSQPASALDAQPVAAPAANRGPLEAAGPQTFEDVVKLVSAERDAMLKVHLEEHMSLISFEPGRIEFFPLDGAPKGLAGELGEKLTKWTGSRWVVVVGREAAQRSIGEVRREQHAAEVAELKSHPAISAIMETFPDAEITAIDSLDGGDGKPAKDDPNND